MARRVAPKGILESSMTGFVFGAGRPLAGARFDRVQVRPRSRDRRFFATEDSVGRFWSQIMGFAGGKIASWSLELAAGNPPTGDDRKTLAIFKKALAASVSCY